MSWLTLDRLAPNGSHLLSAKRLFGVDWGLAGGAHGDADVKGAGHLTREAVGCVAAALGGLRPHPASWSSRSGTSLLRLHRLLAKPLVGDVGVRRDVGVIVALVNHDAILFYVGVEHEVSRGLSVLLGEAVATTAARQPFDLYYAVERLQPISMSLDVPHVEVCETVVKQQHDGENWLFTELGHNVLLDPPDTTTEEQVVVVLEQGEVGECRHEGDCHFSLTVGAGFELVGHGCCLGLFFLIEMISLLISEF